MGNIFKIVIPLLLVVVAVALGFQIAQGERGGTPAGPSVLLSTPLDEALSASRTNKPGSIVIADFSATWCGPCQRMKREFWTREDVRTWLEPRGVAVEVDVDKNPALSQKHSVSGIPLLVVFRDGKEIARSVGYEGPEQTMAFLKSAAGG